MRRALLRYGEAAGEEDEGRVVVVGVVLVLLLLLVVVLVVAVGAGKTDDDGMFVGRGRRGDFEAGAARKQEEPTAATTGSPVSCARGECVWFV